MRAYQTLYAGAFADTRMLHKVQGKWKVDSRFPNSVPVLAAVDVRSEQQKHIDLYLRFPSHLLLVPSFFRLHLSRGRDRSSDLQRRRAHCMSAYVCGLRWKTAQFLTFMWMRNSLWISGSHAPGWYELLHFRGLLVLRIPRR